MRTSELIEGALDARVEGLAPRVVSIILRRTPKGVISKTANS
jgi:hypothetical protein